MENMFFWSSTGRGFHSTIIFHSMAALITLSGYIVNARDLAEAPFARTARRAKPESGTANGDD